MNRENWERIKRLFNEAIELGGEEREAHLAAHADAQEREKVLELIAAHEESQGRPLEPFGFSVLQLENLDLLEEVGSGGMGVVYRAWDKGLERVVAVKVLKSGPGLARSAAEAFREEAMRVSKLRHANIVTVHWVGESRELPHFVMEYLDGQSLQAYLQEAREEGRAPVDTNTAFGASSASYVSRVVEIVAQVADALAYSHEKGIIHRDIKPSNVLIDEDGRPVLVDFGIARERDRETRTQRPLGTLHYMSPEQARLRLSTIDHRTDVYSLGVVCYEMLTLHLPFEGDTDEQIFQAINDQPATPIRQLQPDVPRDLEVICLKAMEKDPKDRYETAGDFAEDLRRFQRHEAPLAQPPTVWRRVKARLRRHRRVVMGAAAVLLAAGGIGTGAVLASDPHWARLNVAVRDGSPEGRVWAVAIDPLLGTTLGTPPRALGTTPLVEAALPPGSYLVQVVATETRWAEAVVHVPTPGELVELAPMTIVPEAEVLEVPQGDPPLTPRDEGMVLIPAGSFLMGNPGDDRNPLKMAYDYEVHLEAFYVDRYETTIAQYRAFLDDTPGHEVPLFWPEDYRDVWSDWEARGITRLPVTGVRPEDARAFAAWAGKRLPTFAEWQRAARGPELNTYPYGDDESEVEQRLNVGPLDDNVSARLALGGIELTLFGLDPQPPDTDDLYRWNWRRFVRFAEPAGNRVHDLTSEGVEDMGGNAREWTATPAFKNPAPGKFSPLYATRITGGTGFDTLPLALFEPTFAPDPARAVAIGFRCVRSAALVDGRATDKRNER